MDTILNQALEGFLGLLRQLVTNLLGSNGSEWGEELKKFLRKEPCWTVNSKSKRSNFEIVGCLRNLTFGRKILIPSITGKRTLSTLVVSYGSNIDKSFMSWGKVESSPSSETQTEVYALMVRVDFKTIFDNFEVDLDLLCLTQHQIITWVEIHAPNSSRLYFLCKAGTEFFVVQISCKLLLSVCPLLEPHPVDPSEVCVIVVPQLTPSIT